MIKAPAVRALSIRQPWADLILFGHKDIENRSWTPPARLLGQRILIHAGKQVDISWSNMISWLRMQQLHNPDIERDMLRGYDPARQGALLGEVTLASCVTSSPSRWFQGPFGFVLSDPTPFGTPEPCRGMLGFFRASRP